MAMLDNNVIPLEYVCFLISTPLHFMVMLIVKIAVISLRKCSLADRRAHAILCEG